jgi:hypothetical protein
LITSTQIIVKLSGVLTDADALPTVTSCTPSATTTVVKASTGTYTLSITDAVASTTYVVEVAVVVGGVEYASTRSLVTPSAGMSLADARTIVRASARNGTDTTAYTDASIDAAMSALMSRFSRTTVYLRTWADLAVTAGAIALPTNVGPEQVMNAISSLDGVALSVVSYPDYKATLLATTTSVVDNPTLLAFLDASHGYVYPVPASTTTLALEYWRYAAMPGSAGTLPDSVLYEILPVGAPWMLHQNEPENARIAGEMQQRYLMVEQTYSAATEYAQTHQMRRAPGGPSLGRTGRRVAE